MEEHESVRPVKILFERVFVVFQRSHQLGQSLHAVLSDLQIDPLPFREMFEKLTVKIKPVAATVERQEGFVSRHFPVERFQHGSLYIGRIGHYYLYLFQEVFQGGQIVPVVEAYIAQTVFGGVFHGNFQRSQRQIAGKNARVRKMAGQRAGYGAASGGHIGEDGRISLSVDNHLHQLLGLRSGYEDRIIQLQPDTEKIPPANNIVQRLPFD